MRGHTEGSTGAGDLDSAERHLRTCRPTDAPVVRPADDAVMSEEVDMLIVGPLTVGAVMTPYPVVVNLDIPVVEQPEEVHWVDNIHPAPKT